MCNLHYHSVSPWWNTDSVRLAGGKSESENKVRCPRMWTMITHKADLNAAKHFRLLYFFSLFCESFGNRASSFSAVVMWRGSMQAVSQKKGTDLWATFNTRQHTTQPVSAKTGDGESLQVYKTTAVLLSLYYLMMFWRLWGNSLDPWFYFTDFVFSHYVLVCVLNTTDPKGHFKELLQRRKTADLLYLVLLLNPNSWE